MANMVFDSFRTDVMAGNIDLDTDTIGVMLVGAGYVPSAAHSKRSDITNEVVGTGYVAGGAVVANVVVSNDAVNHRGKFTHDPVSWANSSITAAGAVYFKKRGGAATADNLIGYVDFGGNKTSTNGEFKITPSAADGALYLG